MGTLQKLHNRIKTEMCKVNITSYDIMNKYGISKDYIEKATVGNKWPSIELIVLLAREMDCNVGYLLQDVIDDLDIQA